MIICIAKDHVECLPKEDISKITAGDLYVGVAVYSTGNHANRRFHAVIVDGVKILPKKVAQKSHQKQIQKNW